MSQISLIRIAVLGLTLAWPALPVSAQTAPAGDEKPAQSVAGAGE